MKKLLFIVLTLLSISAFAVNTNQISMSLNSETWVTTQSAQVTVATNISVKQSELGQVQPHLLDNLKKLAKVDWHITSLDQSQTASGLTTVTAQAQARVGQDHLSDLYSNAKAMSAPGAQYEVAKVDYSPSFDEIQVAQMQMRESLYKQAKDQLDLLNKMFPDSNYQIANIMFNSVSMSPGPVLSMIKMAKSFGNSVAGNGSGAPVSEQLSMTARVSFVPESEQDDQTS